MYFEWATEEERPIVLAALVVDDGSPPRKCFETNVESRPDIATTVAVKDLGVCPEDAAALAEAIREGIVDTSGTPDH